ncbi:type II toxin-antitoxin system RelB/DinJ family antitoxin [Bartonella queenslandensis]|uniref:type II toxin-antitoxin system RelB/DinJ family antitoxin n=1 Tax=Bartonella queenslandensis TaxID=481138 RepID=UPI0002F3A8FB|nr:type II toxin-antitoxin system RelB/DinJ family antitoxin [Bartonella queenslandensis]
MASSHVIQVRVPKHVQIAATQVIKESGLSVSDVVRVLMTRIAQDKVIPQALFQPNAKTLAAFAEVEKGDLPQFETVEELMADLNAED